MSGALPPPILRLALKLRSLAGMGPRAAVVSGASMLLTLLVVIFGSLLPVELAGVLLVVFSTAWLGAMAVTGLDIDWMAHPDTHNGRLLASLWLAVAGTFIPPLLAIVAAAGSPAWAMQLLLCLMGLVAGGFTILHNLEAHRVKILSGVLPWLGIAAGVFFLVFWLGVLLNLPPLVFPGLFAGGVLYAGWATWLGVVLGRKRAPVPAVT